MVPMVMAPAPTPFASNAPKAATRLRIAFLIPASSWSMAAGSRYVRLSARIIRRRGAMLKPTAGFSGFSVDVLTKAKAFYQDSLGMNVDRAGVGLRLLFSGGSKGIGNSNKHHQPATDTVLTLL